MGSFAVLPSCISRRSAESHEGLLCNPHMFQPHEPALLATDQLRRRHYQRIPPNLCLYTEPEETALTPSTNTVFTSADTPTIRTEPRHTSLHFAPTSDEWQQVISPKCTRPNSPDVVTLQKTQTLVMAHYAAAQIEHVRDRARGLFTILADLSAEEPGTREAPVTARRGRKRGQQSTSEPTDPVAAAQTETPSDI